MENSNPELSEEFIKDLAVDEALLIGAEYIFDIFGSRIDGMYVDLNYWEMPGFSRPFWLGTVYATTPSFKPVPEDPYDTEAWAAWSDALVMATYSFRLDAITGGRVDISYGAPSYLANRIPLSDLTILYTTDARERISDEEIDLRVRWWDLDLDTMMAYANLDSQWLEYHKNMAYQLAQRHFNNSHIQTVTAGSQWGSPLDLERVEDGVAIIGNVTFIINDTTGREAIVRIPTAHSTWPMISISTMHNEFIPGFVYENNHQG